jgi:hypothetical protein
MRVFQIGPKHSDLIRHRLNQPEHRMKFALTARVSRVSIMSLGLLGVLIAYLAFCTCSSYAQIKPSLSLLGGDEVPALKTQVAGRLEQVLLEMNRLKKGTGSLDALRTSFSGEAFEVFKQFVQQNLPSTARKSYSAQMISRYRGQSYDIRSIAVLVDVGDTEASDVQNLIFTFSKDAIITSVRAVIPMHDYQSVISTGVTAEDSLTRGLILDFLERFRMAYNTKDLPFLEKVYSDEALIIVGTVLREKENQDDFNCRNLLSPRKLKLLQVTKQDYITGLKNRAFKSNVFLNVKFDSISIVRHEKIPWLYGISCVQKWNSSNYADYGYLFLMMDFRNFAEPTIHVRSWQTDPFDDGSYVGLYDYDVVAYQ